MIIWVKEILAYYDYLTYGNSEICFEINLNGDPLLSQLCASMKDKEQTRPGEEIIKNMMRRNKKYHF